VVWSIPTLTIILLGGGAWIGAHQLDPLAPVAGSGKPLTIQAVSLNWKWLFIYPDQSIATINTHENERIVVITPTRGLFYCFDAKVGGDCLALVQRSRPAHNRVGRTRRGRFLIPAYPGCSQFPGPRAEESGCEQKRHCRRPVAFASKLQYTEQVEQLGFTEALAKDFSIGFYRGQVYIPIRHTDGSISGFVGYADGQLKLRPKWHPATSNVVTFPKKTA